MRLIELYRKTEPEIPQEKTTSFDASGADEYFRRYDYSDTYFSEDRVVYTGRSFPLKHISGVPESDEDAEFYTFYTYAKE